MNISVPIPDDLVEKMGGGPELSRRALEVLAVEAFKARRVTKPELARLLHMAPGELDSFLNLRGFLQLDEAATNRARDAANRIIEMGKGVTLGDISIKDLIDEGRR